MAKTFFFKDSLLKGGQCLVPAFEASLLNSTEHELVILKPSSNGLPFPARDVSCLPMTWPPIWAVLQGSIPDPIFIS